MTAASTADLDRVRQMADRLDCFIEEDFLALTQYTPKTAEALRKRGQGPAYMRLGHRVLYPRQAVADFVQARVRERVSGNAKGLL